MTSQGGCEKRRRNSGWCVSERSRKAMNAEVSATSCPVPSKPSAARRAWRLAQRGAAGAPALIHAQRGLGYRFEPGR